MHSSAISSSFRVRPRRSPRSPSEGTRWGSPIYTSSTGSPAETAFASVEPDVVPASADRVIEHGDVVIVPPEAQNAAWHGQAPAANQTPRRSPAWRAQPGLIARRASRFASCAAPLIARLRRRRASETRAVCCDCQRRYETDGGQPMTRTANATSVSSATIAATPPATAPAMSDSGPRRPLPVPVPVFPSAPRSTNAISWS